MLKRLIAAAALALAATSAWAGNVVVGVGAGSCGYAVSALNTGAAPSCVASPTAVSTATPQPTPTVVNTATPAPTATVQPSPTVIASLPLSLANGGFGIDMSSSFAFQTSKSLGTAGANGAYTAQSIVRVTLPASLSSVTGDIYYELVTSDGTHLCTTGGKMVLTCIRESGGTMGVAKATQNATNSAGVCSTGASLTTSVLTFGTSTGTNTCDLTAANTISTGTATSNTAYLSVIPVGNAGTWSVP